MRLLNLRVQLTMLVRKAVVPFPNVTRLVVGETAEWTRSSATSDDWQPQIVSPVLVRKLLLRRHVRNVDDVNGRLLSTLWEKDLTSEVRARLGYSFKAQNIA